MDDIRRYIDLCEMVLLELDKLNEKLCPNGEFLSKEELRKLCVSPDGSQPEPDSESVVNK